MSYAAPRSMAAELSRLLDKKVVVRLVDGKLYTGRLLSFDQSALHLVLGDAEAEGGSRYHRVVINGSRVSEVILEEQPLFDAEEFAAFVTSRLGLRSDAVKVLSNVNAVIIYDKIKVSEAGVEGSGSLAQKIYEVFNEYVEAKKRGQVVSK